MKNFIEYLINNHSFIFTIWFALLYFPFMFFLKRFFTKIDSTSDFNYITHRKNQAELIFLESKFDNENYKIEDLKIIDYRKTALILKNDLKLNENNLSILKFINFYENIPEALPLYKNCKDLLTYDVTNNKLVLKNNINIDKYSTFKPITKWIWNTGIFLNFIFILVLILDPSIKDSLENPEYFLSTLFFTILLISLIFFKISKYFERYDDALTLLSLPRIDASKLND